MKINEIEIDFKILTKFCHISSLDTQFYANAKKEFIEKYGANDRMNDIIIEKSITDKVYYIINVSLNQFNKEIILSNSSDFRCPTFNTNDSFCYYGSKTNGHYAGVHLSIRQTFSFTKSVTFKISESKDDIPNYIYQPIIDTIVSILQYNKFANLEFTIIEIENIHNAPKHRLAVATIKCLKELFNDEIKV